MARLNLAGVSVELPIYHASARSMRRSALNGALGRKLHLDHGRMSVPALTDIDLDLKDGDELALLGPNGAGKSILLRTMAGAYAPARGQVTRVGRGAPLLSPGIGPAAGAPRLENISRLGMRLDIPPRAMRGRVEEIVDWT